FSSSSMPNHAFLAILTDFQISHNPGKKWLKLLKEQGFEFIRTVDNSVYSGPSTISEPGKGCTSAHPNYIFGLFRNIGQGAIADPYTPPEAWTELDSVVPEAWERMSNGDNTLLNEEVQRAQLHIYNNLPEKTFLSESDIKK